MRSVPLVLALLLSACGGGDKGVSPPPAPAPERGSMVAAASVAVEKMEPAVFAALLDVGQPGTTRITGNPQCAITTHTVRYNTVGGAGEPTEASAAIVVPSGAAANCSGARPVLLYAHATSVEKSYDMANLRENREARLVAAIFAARGYIVVAPNYAGYARSSLAYHPYLNADQQGADMIDALRAARLAFGAIGASASAKLFVTGYSQGGYVALATQRAMESMNSANFAPTAVAGLSGPYALAQFGDTQFAGSPRIGVTAFLPMLISAGQLSGEHVYGSTSELYEDQYAATIETLMPGVGTVGDLVNAGKLPANALFAADSMPQASGYGKYFGAGNLIKTVFRDAYLADAQAHPCDLNGGIPLACAPENSLRKLFRKNDLRNYEPVAPLLLCGGSGDPTVPYLNTVSALAYFYARPHPGQLIEVDLDDFPGLRDPYRTPKLSFIAAKVALRAAAIGNGDSPDEAVESNYHAGLAAPFCMTATRDFFQEVLAR
jgi:acetyl esterase/lipase